MAREEASAQHLFCSYFLLTQVLHSPLFSKPRSFRPQPSQRLLLTGRARGTQALELHTPGCGSWRDPRCSPRGNPACGGTFGGRRKAVSVWMWFGAFPCAFGLPSTVPVQGNQPLSRELNGTVKQRHCRFLGAGIAQK